MGRLARGVNERQEIRDPWSELEDNFKMRTEELSVPVNSMCKCPGVEENLVLRVLKKGRSWQWPGQGDSCTLSKEKLKDSM